MGALQHSVATAARSQAALQQGWAKQRCFFWEGQRMDVQVLAAPWRQHRMAAVLQQKSPWACLLLLQAPRRGL
jgi:hypothetical protein